MNKIKYISGYKYQLQADYLYNTHYAIAEDVYSHFLTYSKDGMLGIQSGYAWDGPSAIAIDTKNILRASLVHDALYQLIREGKLPNSYRSYADYLLFSICREDGMSLLRATWVYIAVILFGNIYSSPKNSKQVQSAP